VNFSASKKVSCLLEAFAGDHKTNGGDKDRLAKLFAVIPIGPFLPLHVTIVTPVVYFPKADLNSS
jgi:hypothetical protein